MRLLKPLMTFACLLTTLVFVPDALAQSPSTAPSATAKASSPVRVLLSAESTRFKDSLVARMKTLLEADGYEVTVVPHSDRGLNPGSAERFSAIFISNSGVNSQVRPWVLDWLKANTAHSRKVLLHTTQRSNWAVNAGVDSVASASPSAAAEIDRLAAEYVARLKKIAPGAAR